MTDMKKRKIREKAQKRTEIEMRYPSAHYHISVAPYADPTLPLILKDQTLGPEELPEVTEGEPEGPSYKLP